MMIDSLLLILILPMHSLMSQRENPSHFVRFPEPLFLPSQRCEATKDFAEFRFYYAQCIWLIA